MSSTKNQSNKKFKLILVGDGAVGKTAFVNRHRTGDFRKNYVNTMGVDASPVSFSTNYGDFTFNCWDHAGKEMFKGIGDGNYIGADACILMFSTTSMESYDSLPRWYQGVRRVCPNIPMVLCGSKVDCRDRKVMPKDILFHRKHKLEYYDISSKSNYNYEKPFLYLLRKLTGKEDLCFIEDKGVEEVVEQVVQLEPIEELVPTEVAVSALTDLKGDSDKTHKAGCQVECCEPCSCGFTQKKKSVLVRARERIALKKSEEKNDTGLDAFLIKLAELANVNAEEDEDVEAHKAGCQVEYCGPCSCGFTQKKKSVLVRARERIALKKSEEEDDIRHTLPEWFEDLKCLVNDASYSLEATNTGENSEKWFQEVKQLVERNN